MIGTPKLIIPLLLRLSSLLLRPRQENLLAHVHRLCNGSPMTTRFTYWIEADGKYLGYLNDYPDHWTQGDNIQDLKDHLRDLHETFSAEDIPGIKKESELELA